MSAHRVSLLRPSLRRYPDPAKSRDPQVRSVVDRLNRLTVAPGPDAGFRSELRAQLVAITPRMVAEGAEQIAREAAVELATATDAAVEDPADDVPHPARHARQVGRVSGARTLHFARGLKIATATLTVLVLLLGAAVWLSRSALPGDTLYGLKRASENVQLATASSDTSRASDYLQFAQTRTAEVKALLARSSTSGMGAKPGASGAIDAQTASLIEQTLSSSDSDVRSATSLLGRTALRQHSAAPLQTMTSWAPGQLARLNTISTDMPLGALRTHAARSSALVTAAAHRAAALHNLVRCACMTGAASDQLGPVPCTVCSSTPATKHGSQPTQKTGATSKRKGSGSGSSAPTGGAAPQVGGSSSGTTRGGTAGVIPKIPSPGSKLPSFPLPKPSSPKPPKASVGSCGISVSIIGLKIAVGTCSSKHK